MRAPFSSSMPRLAVVAALVASSAGLANALDEESVADNLQPYIGGWVGMYQVNTDDLELMVAKNRGNGVSPRVADFTGIVPVGGISMGVAHGRLHLGANLGYQLRNGGDLSKSLQTSLALHPGFRYEVIPLDVNVDLAMLPNEYPVNLLVGGSAGIGFTRIQNPFKELSVIKGTDTTTYQKDNEFYTNNFVLATGYIGARINLARRLNLEGQVGYRLLSTDAVEFGEDPYPAQLDNYTVDSSGNIKGIGLKPIEVDLSGLYARVDLRWTFASKAEKERSARLEKRRESLARLDSRFALKD
jgi:hypothetical protein